MGAPLSCVFCPPADELGFTLGDHSNNNGVLFCSYPAAPGENPNDFYCEYDSSTGTQRRDNDAAASTTCDLSKRALALKRKPVAAQPQAAAPAWLIDAKILGPEKEQIVLKVKTGKA
ncbi:hypothetical protein FRB96_003336 [Tulasnella sp. 330]|nr:hypothetical protein FRB96_003336 [Tulasnella sp. 330]